VSGIYRQHCWFCEGRGQAPAWRTGLTHDSICPKCSGSGFADTTIESITAERDALARTLATLAAAGIVVGEDGAVRWQGLTGAEIERLQEIETAARDLMDFMPDPADPDAYRTTPDGDPVIAWSFVGHAALAIHDLIDALALAAAAGREAEGEAT
jgi:hypothetical protein